MVGLLVALVFVGYRRIRSGVDAAPGLAARAASTPYDGSKLFRPAAEDILAVDSEFTLGATPPFEVEPANRKEVDVDFKVQHGGEVLLRAEYTLAYTWNDDFRERTGWTLRSRTLSTPHGVRALVLVHVDDAEPLTGPDSIERGRVTFYAALYSGEGDDEFFLYSSATPPKIQSATRRTSALGLEALAENLGLIAPGSTLPAEGLLYEVRRELYLGAEVDCDGERRSTWGPHEAEANFVDEPIELSSAIDSREGRDGRSRKSWTHSIRTRR